MTVHSYNYAQTLGRVAPSYARAGPGRGAYCCFARRPACLRATPVAREGKPPEGIEPPLRELESRVIPLDQSGCEVEFV